MEEQTITPQTSSAESASDAHLLKHPVARILLVVGLILVILGGIYAWRLYRQISYADMVRMTQTMEATLNATTTASIDEMKNYTADMEERLAAESKATSSSNNNK